MSAVERSAPATTEPELALIGSALAAAFPGCPFTVEAGPGGATHVGWTDGPSVGRVRSKIAPYCRYTMSSGGGRDAEASGIRFYGGGRVVSDRQISAGWRAEL